MKTWELFTFSLLLVGAFCFFIYFFFFRSATPYSFSVPDSGHKAFKIKDRVFKLEVADTNYKRMQGLSGRESMAADEGMIFIFASPGKYGFWMKDMNFPIDIIWLDKNKIVHIEENLPPASVSGLKTYYPAAPADSVLELNAGEAKRLGLRTHDQLSL